ncbi:MAG: mechanosensitive ion channel [Parachlamydiales bacterium]|nr:mechanosensitive ion channel [Parachlamydiales bacterium]
MKDKFVIRDFILLNYVVILKTVAVLILVSIFTYLLSIIYKKMHPRFVKSKRFWDDALIFGLYRPFIFAIWLYAVSLAFFLYPLDEKAYVIISEIRSVGLVLLVLWFFVRVIRRVELNLFKISLSPKGKLDKTSLRAISQLLRLAAILIAVLILLQTMGIPISGVIAFGGFSGIALGFAAKDMLANFFGGLMIFLDRPFAIGDWIKCDEKHIEGYVEHIGWRLTRVRTFEKRPLYVPNGLFSNMTIENPSRMQNRRIKTTFGLRYEDSLKVAPLLEDVETMLKNHPDIDQSKITFVAFDNFGPSALEILLYTFTKTVKWVEFQKVQQDIFLKIIDIVHKHNAQCAFPTSTIHIPDEIKFSKNFEK